VVLRRTQLKKLQHNINSLPVLPEGCVFSKALYEAEFKRKIVRKMHIFLLTLPEISLSGRVLLLF